VSKRWTHSRDAELAATERTDEPRGEALSNLLGKPWDLGAFLRVGAGVARALGGVHQRGNSHVELRPWKVLLNLQTGDAWLMGGNGLLPPVHQPPVSVSAAANSGTFTYMAPEQTGWMSRSVDSRSDLYSFGIILYEMLTGMPPCQVREPMEWIHCHIARQPTPPSERSPTVPAVVSALVMKLLAKNAEDRYQTAAGVEMDLRRCLSEWESAGRIGPFELGAQDVPDRLLIPERFYGRAREVKILVEAFGRVAREGKQSMVLVSGYSGVGKSSIVNELQRVVVSAHGLFAWGKFDPHERDIPFAPITRAFRDVVRWLLLSSDAELKRWSEELHTALGDNAGLVVDLVPDLERVIGPQRPVGDLPPQQARIRLQRLLQRFVGVFARAEHPLVLFVDDLQWLDRATLDLLRNLATHDEGMHLLLVGAYRSNEVGQQHPLSQTLVAIRGATQVEEVDLAPLGEDDVRELTHDALRLEPGQVEPLVKAVYEKTAGNPFFVIQFLRELADEGLLALDTTSGTWAWDLSRIQAKGYTENVFDLLAGKLERLPAATKEALKCLACLGGV
jgi:hypothetical protein